MKLYTSLIIILFFVSKAYTQIDSTANIFVGIQPKWAHTIIDSSAIGYKSRTGMNYFTNIIKGDFLIVGDDVYVIYVNIFDDFSGSHIEKIDLNMGVKKWDAHFDLRTSDHREQTNDFFINEAGQLEVLGYQHDQDTFIIVWNSGKFTVRKYDTLDGRLIYEYKAPLTDSTFPNFGVFFSYTNLVKLKDSMYACYENFPHEEGFLKTKTVMNEYGKLIRRDSAVSKTRNGYYYTDSYPPRYVNGDHSVQAFIKYKKKNKELFNTDSFQVQLEVFDENLNTLFNYDVTEKVDSSDKYDLFAPSQNHFIILSSERVQGNYDRERLEVFDKEGNLVEKIVYNTLKNDPFGYITGVIKLKDEPGVLIMNFTNKGDDPYPKRHIFYKSDGSGNLRKLSEFMYRDTFGGGLASIKVLDDGDLLMSALYRVGGRNSDRVIERCIISRWDGKEMGIVSGVTNKVKVKNEVIIYPNPADDQLFLKMDYDKSLSLYIFDDVGVMLNEQTFNPSLNKSIDIKNLPTGIYHIQLNEKNGMLFYAGSFVKGR
ncbi:MAG: T9SS type A sorting domain-containing protein [Saprospiraceae bacterium]|nr:T9SS type A sorting domain-containing protein [Saprospiraceae bacterium]